MLGTWSTLECRYVTLETEGKKELLQKHATLRDIPRG
jgi:hypothetical protein